MVKTLRDDFALLYLAPMLQVDMLRQSQGYPPQDHTVLIQNAYKAADEALKVWDEIMRSSVSALKVAN